MVQVENRPPSEHNIQVNTQVVFEVPNSAKKLKIIDSIKSGKFVFKKSRKQK
jgi:hypothetical protein